MIFSIDAGRNRRLIFRFAAVFVVICFSVSSFAQDMPRVRRPRFDKNNPDYIRGKSDGKEDADKYYSGVKWRNGGFVGGLLTGLAGTILILGISQIENSEPEREELTFLNATSPEYQYGYCRGYLRKARTKRIGPVLVGGVVGSLFGAGIAYAVIKTRK